MKGVASRNGRAIVDGLSKSPSISPATCPELVEGSAELGWGPLLRRGTDSLRSFGKLRMVSNADGVIEPLAGDHAHGVTSSRNGSKRLFAR